MRLIGELDIDLYVLGRLRRIETQIDVFDGLIEIVELDDIVPRGNAEVLPVFRLSKFDLVVKANLIERGRAEKVHIEQKDFEKQGDNHHDCRTFRDMDKGGPVVRKQTWHFPRYVLK